MKVSDYRTEEAIKDHNFILSLFYFFSYRSSLALHRRSSTEILPDYWSTFCAGVYPMSVFSFLAAAGFKPTSW